jgi:dTDP-glucose 4,6-dehydratase
MKLLVTGGAGFIGSNFIRYYLSAHPEDSIINFDALTYAGNLDNVADVATNPRYTFIKGDIRRPDQVRAAIKDVDVVVHFAAESHVDRSITGPGEFVLTNVVGTQVMLDAVRELKISRFHHISTDEVFGALPLDSEARFDESTPYDPHSPYSAAKAGADHLVRAYFDTYQLPATITNCSNNYGPYHFPEKLIPLAITNLIDGKKVPLYGDGLNVRDWLHVEDHARAIDLVLHHGKIGTTYLVGGHGEKPNREVIETILQLMGKDASMIEAVADRPGHDRRYAIDPSKIESELGWKPTLSFEDGLEQTIQWYQEHQEWWRKVKSGAYLDYYQQQYGGRV